MTGTDVGGPAAQGSSPGVHRVRARNGPVGVTVLVAPSVYVAARDAGGALLLVRRADRGTWGLPGGGVAPGESAVAAAVRRTLAVAGIRVRITGLVGLFTDPARAVAAPAGPLEHQRFVACFHGWALDGVPHADMGEADAAAWFHPSDVVGLVADPREALLVHRALSGDPDPCLE